MKQLIEEQNKIETDFNAKFGFGIWEAGIRKIFSSDVLEFIKEKNKQSLKQFIDELIAREEEQLEFARQESINYGVGDGLASKGFRIAKGQTLSHLKELKEELN